MIDDETAPVSAALANEIEDAIMFGKAHDIAAVLDSIPEEEFPTDLRKGLESLYYFRDHYGNQPPDNATDKKKVMLMEQSWAMEILNKLRARIESAVKRA